MNPRTLDDLLSDGEALIEARTNPSGAGKKFSDFGQAYHEWNLAGKRLMARLYGPSAASEWTSGWCRAMQTLDQLPDYCLQEQRRQQAMLQELRASSVPQSGPKAQRRFAGRAIPGEKAVSGKNAPPAQSAQKAPPAQIPAAETGANSREVARRPYVLRADNRELTNEQILADLQRVAKELGKNTMTFDEYNGRGNCNSVIFTRRFGSWNKALQAAGLEVGVYRNVSTEDLFDNLARVWQALGRQPVDSDMVKPLTRFAVETYARRFGTWRGALRAFAKWANEGLAPEAPPAVHSDARRSTPRFPSIRLRYLVLKRDSFKCTACGRNPPAHPGTELHVDHKIPWSRGGPTTLDNLRTLCEKCNLGKSNSEFPMPNAE